MITPTSTLGGFVVVATPTSTLGTTKLSGLKSSKSFNVLKDTSFFFTGLEVVVGEVLGCGFFDACSCKRLSADFSFSNIASNKIHTL